jgi:hypothetical protein
MHERKEMKQGVGLKRVGCDNVKLIHLAVVGFLIGSCEHASETSGTIGG